MIPEQTELLTQLHRLASYVTQPGWCGEESEAVEYGIIEAAKRFFSLMPPGMFTIQPWIEANYAGTLSIVWYRPNILLELEFRTKKRIHVECWVAKSGFLDHREASTVDPGAAIAFVTDHILGCTAA